MNGEFPVYQSTCVVYCRHYQTGLRLDPEHGELKKEYFKLKALLRKTKSVCFHQTPSPNPHFLRWLICFLYQYELVPSLLNFGRHLCKLVISFCILPLVFLKGCISELVLCTYVTLQADEAFEKSKFRTAVEEYTSALEIAPDHTSHNIRLHLGLCKALVKLGRGRDAVTRCSLVLEIDSESLEALVQVSIKSLSLGRLEILSDVVRNVLCILLQMSKT